MEDEPPTPIPTGETMLAGLQTFLAGILRGSTDFESAVILACDVSGYKDHKIRELAIKIAKNGHYVVVPDFCRGDPFVPPDDPSGCGRSFSDWLQDHDPSDDAFEDAKLMCLVLKYNNKKVGAIGVGWGAKVVAELAIPRPPELHLYYVNAAVLLDPFSVTMDDFKGGLVPTLVLAAGITRDHVPSWPSELLKELPNNPDAESKVVRIVKLVPVVTNNEDAVEREKKVLKEIFDWFGQHMRIYPHWRKFERFAL